MDREKVISELNEYIESALAICAPDVDYIPMDLLQYTVALLKKQDALLEHEYRRGYNNGRADERGLQEGTIMQTFSPD